MAGTTEDILKSAESGLAAQEAELAGLRARQMLNVVAKTATGTGDINQTFTLERTFRLVFIRCHFSGTLGAASLLIAIDSANGTPYDALLFTINKAGTNRDVHFRISAEESTEPSPWTFQVGDAVRVTWTNPDTGNITWGLEVGLAIAS